MNVHCVLIMPACLVNSAVGAGDAASSPKTCFGQNLGKFGRHLAKVIKIWANLFDLGNIKILYPLHKNIRYPMAMLVNIQLYATKLKGALQANLDHLNLSKQRIFVLSAA